MRRELDLTHNSALGDPVDATRELGRRLLHVGTRSADWKASVLLGTFPDQPEPDKGRCDGGRLSQPYATAGSGKQEQDGGEGDEGQFHGQMAYSSR